MRAALYIRVSTTKQAEEGLSLEAQEQKLREFCSQNNIEVAGIYADEGISAKDTTHRVQFKKMLSDAGKHDFDVVMIWKLSRFARNTRDLLNSIDTLEKCGVGLKSYSEPIDTTTASGKMITTVIGAMAQFERDMVSENVKMVTLYRAEQGKRTCNEVLGYDLLGKDSFSINPDEAARVRYIFDNFLNCHSFSKVAENCKLKGYRGKRGAELEPWHIERILTCTVYAGYNRLHDKVYKGDYKSIVTVDEYNAVIDIIAALRAGRRRERALIKI